MNIVVVRPDGSWYTRPDTTIEREEKDFYLPDDFSYVVARRCRFIRIIKAGKAIGQKFAGRYFDTVGRGWTLYGGTMEFPYIDGSTLLEVETESVATLGAEELKRMVGSLCSITGTTSVRIGDIVLFEEGDGEKIEKGSRLGKISIL